MNIPDNLKQKQVPETYSFYDEWLVSEGIPVYKGYYVEDLTELELGSWPRKGGRGAFINLKGSEQSNDAYLCEISLGQALKPQKHLYEEIIFVLSGRGATTIWNEGGSKRTFEWHEGSLFSPPLNTWHQHFNGQGDKPVLYLGMTTAPTMLNLTRSADFIFSDPYIFHNRYNEEEDYFSGKGKLLPGRVWESNFIPDVQTFQLLEWKERGGKGTNIRFHLAGNAISAHISEFPPGYYKKAHRHGPGAHIIILGGEGYSLMWPEGRKWQKINWRKNSLFVPPNALFHQHFNTGSEPARYLALHWGSLMGHGWWGTYQGTVSLKMGGDQIEYEDEDPAIRELYSQELGKKGIEIRMPAGK